MCMKDLSAILGAEATFFRCVVAEFVKIWLVR